MSKEKDVFKEFLAGKGFKFTGQRAVVLEAFLESEKHLSTDDLYSLVRKKNKNVGYATVHRTLKLIREAGLAREVDFGEGRRRFEHLLGHQHHDHFICLQCKSTIEFFEPKIEALQERIALRYGFKPSNHAMEIFGTCKRCGS